MAREAIVVKGGAACDNNTVRHTVQLQLRKGSVTGRWAGEEGILAACVGAALRL
jgi:hypothetical protein